MRSSDFQSFYARVLKFGILVSCIHVIMCLNFQLDQSPHKGGAFLPPPGPGIESQTPVQIGLRLVVLYFLLSSENQLTLNSFESGQLISARLALIQIVN